MVVLLATSPGQAQFTRKAGHETNANRRSRIARQIAETYSHRWEVGGGGGFLRFSPGESTQKNNEVTFWTDVTYFFNQNLGLTGELRGAYGNGKVPNYTAGANNVGSPQISEYPFLVGPTYRLRMREKTSVGAFLLGGTAIGKFDGDTKGIPVGFWPSTNARPAFSVGANVDLNLYPNLAFRIAPSYLMTTFGGSVQNNLGFDLGLVYRFGRQK